MVLSLSAALCFVPASSILGDTAAAVGSQGLPIAFSQFDTSQGWRFNVDSPIRITALGLMDANLDGFQAEHPIAIFKSDGSMVVGSLIEAGTVHPLINKFRYVSLAGPDQVILNPGENYTIAYFNQSWATADTFVVWNGTHTMHPTINQVGASVFDFSGELLMPESESASQCFGPNFQFTVVPGPGGIALLALGLCPRRRRRRE